MAVADARAIFPDLVTRPADIPLETATLASLRRWTGRYAPMVGTDGTDGLIADISGIPHLFGGEESLRKDLHARLRNAGFLAVSAIAETRGAAHALSRHGGGIIADGRLAEGIGHLPVTSLRIDRKAAKGLSRMGMLQIGDLIPLPRAPLARRFGQELILRLDQALGAQSEPVSAEPDAPHFGVRIILPEPIGLQSDVMAGLNLLLEKLCRKLALHHVGARKLRLELRRVDRNLAQVQIGLARPMRDPARISALFARSVNEVESGLGIDAMRLCTLVTEALAPEQIGSGPVIDHEDALADLLSSIGNRIGFDRALRLLSVESLTPERSFLLAPSAHTTSEPPRLRTGPRRPIILFPPEPVIASSGRPPAGFRWRQMRFTTLHAIGPERIAPEWWLDDPGWRAGLRDYWRVETQEGPRLWLFGTPQTQDWYIQGEFA